MHCWKGSGSNSWWSSNSIGIGHPIEVHPCTVDGVPGVMVYDPSQKDSPPNGDLPYAALVKHTEGLAYTIAVGEDRDSTGLTREAIDQAVLDVIAGRSLTEWEAAVANRPQP